MVSKTIHDKHLHDIKSLALVFDKLAIPTALEDLREENSTSSLQIQIKSDPDRPPWNFQINYIATSEEELEFAKYLQFFAELDPIQGHQDQIQARILDLNAAILFGNFGILNGEKLYFRYVLTLPQFFDFDKDFLFELLEMLLYSMDGYYSFLDHSE